MSNFEPETEKYEVSNREKHLWLAVIIDIIALVWFLDHITTTPVTAAAYGWYFIKNVAMIVVICTLASIIFSMIYLRSSKVEPMDERDHIIHLKGYKTAYVAFFFFMGLIAGHIILNGVLNWPDLTTTRDNALHPLVLMNMIFVTLVLTGLTKDIAILYNYRKSMQ